MPRPTAAGKTSRATSSTTSAAAATDTARTARSSGMRSCAAMGCVASATVARKALVISGEVWSSVDGMDCNSTAESRSLASGGLCLPTRRATADGCSSTRAGRMNPSATPPARQAAMVPSATYGQDTAGPVDAATSASTRKAATKIAKAWPPVRMPVSKSARLRAWRRKNWMRSLSVIGARSIAPPCSSLKPPNLKLRGLDSPYVGIAVGLLGGIIGGFTAFPGAPVVVWLGLRGLAKVQHRAVLQPYLIMSQIYGLALVALLHPSFLNNQFLFLLMLGLPAVFPGTLIGVAIYKRISDRCFRRILYLPLAIAGIALLTKTYGPAIMRML